jgi:hypothetical protein
MVRMKKVLGFLLALLIGVGLTWTGYNEWQNSKKLVAEGKSAVAQVTSHYTYKSRRSSRKYKLVVAFETEAKQAQKQTVQVSSSVYHKAANDGTVQVHYLPSDPSVVQAGPKAEVQYGSLVLGLLFLVGSVGVLVFFVGVAFVHRGGPKTVASVNAKVGERPPVVNQDGSQTIASLPAKDDAQNFRKVA